MFIHVPYSSFNNTILTVKLLTYQKLRENYTIHLELVVIMQKTY